MASSLWLIADEPGFSSTCESNESEEIIFSIFYPEIFITASILALNAQITPFT
jgi:hypothetical protein